MHPISLRRDDNANVASFNMLAKLFFGRPIGLRKHALSLNRQWFVSDSLVEYS